MAKNDKTGRNLIEPLPMVRVLLLHMIELNPKISGYSLINKISEFSNNMVELRTGTVYNELRKLEKNGSLISTQEKTSRKIREYTITESGSEELANLMSIVNNKIQDILQPLLRSYFGK